MSARPKRGFTFFDVLRSIAGVALVTLAGGLRRALREASTLEVVQVELAIPDLPPAWHGVRLALVADIHAHGTRDVRRIRKIVQTASSAACEAVILAGDVISADIRRPALATRELATLSAPLGVYAVLGNHECFRRQEAVALLQEAGVEVLINDHHVLTRDGQPLCLAGIDDLRWGHPDIRAALAGVDPATPRILISHNPDAAEDVPADVRVDAMLSGHTHGGQVRLWKWGPAASPIRHNRYLMGLNQGPGFPVYTSRGLGTVALPIRFHCPPELTVLTLLAAEPETA